MCLKIVLKSNARPWKRSLKTHRLLNIRVNTYENMPFSHFHTGSFYEESWCVSDKQKLFNI